MAICKRLLIILICGFMISACATTSKQPNICETTTEPSYLCEVANKHGFTLEGLGGFLITSNMRAMDMGAYRPDDALEVLTYLRDILENPVSYLFFRGQVRKQFAKHPGIFKEADLIAQEFKSPRIMYNFDRAILRSWLSSRIKAVEELREWPQ